MSTADTTPEHHDHPPHLQHHFDSPEQQFESAVLGMWLFLATEILLFAGLFCAYAVYRAAHPEIFIYAHHFLSTKWGAINTVVLLCSSFTMAAAVWAVQHSYQRMLCWMLGLTILCACGFLGIKYVEYKAKWEEGLMWGKHYQPTAEALAHVDGGHGHGDEHADGEPAAGAGHDDSHGGDADAHADEEPVMGSESGKLEPPTLDPEKVAQETVDAQWFYKPVRPGPTGLADPGDPPAVLTPADEVRNVHTFFGVYFLMTGLHGVHVIAGMIAIGWVLVRSWRGDFSADYFTPVPMVGLYWHVVDLVWIYLFPLLYLIH